MSAEEHFPRLAGFLADWLGEGWREEGFATPAEATRAFAGRTSRLMRRGLVAEIHQLLSRRFPPARLRHLLCAELGLAYDPAAEGGSFEAWLKETAQILAVPEGPAAA